MFVAEHIVAEAADLTLIDLHRGEPAPLLPVLHAFHDRDGYLSQTAIEVIGKELRIPLADLFGTVTFYHHFAREAPGQSSPRVCTGPVCCQRGGQEILASLPGATAMACAAIRSPSSSATRHLWRRGRASWSGAFRPRSPRPIPAGSKSASFVTSGKQAGPHWTATGARAGMTG